MATKRRDLPELQSLKRPELLKLAREHEVKGAAQMKKDELVESVHEQIQAVKDESVRDQSGPVEAAEPTTAAPSLESRIMELEERISTLDASVTRAWERIRLMTTPHR